MTITRSKDVFPFTSLTPEIVNNILHLSNHASLKSLLSLNRAITPLVRGILFKSVALELGAPKYKERLLLSVLEGGDGVVGKLVRNLRISPPSNDDAAFDNPNLPVEELIKALTPVVVGLSRKEINNILSKLLVKVNNLISLHIEVYLCTKIEGLDETVMEGEKSAEDKLVFETVKEGLCSMVNLRSFILGVQHYEKKLEILSSLSYQSPYIFALSSWSNLTSLDLWTIHLSIPQSTNRPTYRLKSLSLSFCTFDSIDSLEWLIGSASHLHQLTSMSLNEIEFESISGSSEPLLSLFYPTCAFANTLTSLSIYLRYPFTPTLDTTPSSSSIFTSFTILKTLELAGNGITEPLMLSLLPSPAAPRIPTPSSTLKILLLNSTTSLSLPFLSQYFRSSSPPLNSNSNPNLTDSNLNNQNWTKLKSLDFVLPISNSRTTTWSEMKSLTWELLPRSSFREIIKWSKAMNLLRVKGKLRLMKNGIRVEDWGEESNSEDEEEEGSESDEDALWQPPEEVDEVVAAVEEDSSDSE